MKILVLGSKGQLGQCLNDQLAITAHDVVYTSRGQINIADFEVTKAQILEISPDIVINASAYTAVDKAEENAETADQVNSLGVQNLVNALEKVNGKLIHISTDYVFDGSSLKPYKESDKVNPIGVYGETKRAGELSVINSNIDSIVIRTSWLYSSFGNNFVKTMLRLGFEKDSLSVINDQIGTPTYAKDLAKSCLDILSIPDGPISKKGKVYHYSNEGVASWYDFAIVIMELAGLNCKVNSILTKDYSTLAKRPHYSVLNKTKIKEDFKIEIPYWKDSLKECISKLKQ